MAVDAGTLIRVGSASLFVLVAIAILVLAPRRRSLIAPGVLYAVLGGITISNNLWRDDSPLRLVVLGGLMIAFAASALITAVVFPRPLRRDEAPALLVGVLIGVLSVAAMRAVGPDTFDLIGGVVGASSTVRTTMRILFTIGFTSIASFVAIVSARVAFRPPRDPKGWRRAAVLALSIGFWWCFQVATVTVRPWSAWAFVATLTFVAGTSALWFVGAVRSGERFPARVALVWPAIALTCYLYLLLPQNGAGALYDAWGLIGISRLVGWSLLAYGILRLDLLGVPLPRFAVHRGAVAAGALATLFIVAQIAENFFSAEYGLLTGGALAGVFVFAASPIQQLIERIGGASTGGGAGAQEAAYRMAVRLAWKDRRFTPREELELARLADTLRLPALRATAIRHEVEHELDRG